MTTFDLPLSVCVAASHLTSNRSTAPWVTWRDVLRTCGRSSFFWIASTMHEPGGTSKDCPSLNSTGLSAQKSYATYSPPLSLTPIFFRSTVILADRFDSLALVFVGPVGSSCTALDAPFFDAPLG